MLPSIQDNISAICSQCRNFSYTFTRTHGEIPHQAAKKAGDFPQLFNRFDMSNSLARWRDRSTPIYDQRGKTLTEGRCVQQTAIYVGRIKTALGNAQRSQVGIEHFAVVADRFDHVDSKIAV